MTLNDVKKDVAALGFEREIELDQAFLGAVNRAMSQLFTERALTNVMRIKPLEPKVALFKKEIRHNGNESVNLSAVCRAFAFHSFGEGELLVEDDFGKTSYRFKGENQTTRAFVRGNAKFCFSGEFCYTIRDFTLFSEIESADISDILPMCEVRFYDPKKYDADFCGFSSYPYDDKGNLITQCVIDSRGLGVRLPYNGCININYRIKPKALSADDVNEEIRIPDGTEHLLSLLVAHYVWLDDDFTKSQHYLNLYHEGMSALKFYSRDYRSCEISTNGWA